ncbi:Peroxisomal membrane protein PAS20 [Lecanora helva]
MAAAVSPPKPWERNGAASGTSSIPPANPPTSTSATPAAATSSTTSSGAPALPTKPSSLTTAVNRNSSNYSPYNQNRYGATTSPYSGIGGIGGYNNYSSPYSRFGGIGNSMYGGYGGGYGSMYGGMGGYGGMYGGGMGRPGMMGGDPNDPNSLTNSFSQSTQATFQVIESIVSAFGGVAQMLDSTYMATHSSFFAMVSVAEQFSNLRNTLGSILGIFTLLRYIRTLIAKITGRPPPADATSLTPSAFASFQGLSSSSSASTLSNGQPTPSKKPFLIFIAAVIGLPYLMTKLIRSMAQQNETNSNNQLLLGPDGRPLPPDQQQQPIDPSKLDFCRLLYDYTPESTLQGHPPTQGIDLEVKKGDLVAVLSKSDPMGNASDWWRCRARDGRVGYLPGVYLEAIQRRPIAPKEIEDGSRINTMSSLAGGSGGEGSRANSIKKEKIAEPPKELGKVGDISAESFQRSQFYN